MIPLRLSRYTGCQLRPVSQRYITTIPPKPATLAQIRYELLNRRQGHSKEHISNTKSTQLLKSITSLHSIEPRHADLTRSSDGQLHLPQGHHLLYFNPTHPSSALLPDGTDLDHAPGPPFTRRVWASGSVSFAEEWRSHLTLNKNSAWSCEETITGVRLQGVPRADGTTSGDALGASDKIFVDITRQYSVRPRITVITERRTLCFMAPKTADQIKAALNQPGDKIVKCKLIPHPASFKYIASN